MSGRITKGGVLPYPLSRVSWYCWFAIGGVKDPAKLSSWCLAKLAGELPAGTYRLAEGEPGPALHGWQTAQYKFSRYKEDKEPEGSRAE